MRLPRPTASTLTVLLFAAETLALPFHLQLRNPFEKRQSCPVECGSICCTSSQKCLWDGQCGTDDSSGAGTTQWAFFTSTWVVTDTDLETKTSVWSSAVTKGPSASQVPTSTWKAPVVTSTGPSSGVTFPTGGVVLTTIGTSKIYISGSATLTGSYLVNPTADFSGGAGGVIGGDASPQGLTSAQIGGIVGGILGAFFLIALVLLCCCMRKGFDGFFGWMNTIGHRRRHDEAHSHSHGVAGPAAAGGLMGYLLGRRKDKTTTTTHHVSSHSEHAGSHGRKSGGGGLAALLGGAAAGVGSWFASRKSRDRYEEKHGHHGGRYGHGSTTESSYYTSDMTTSSYTTSEVSSSSDSSSSSSSSSSSGHPHGHHYSAGHH